MLADQAAATRAWRHPHDRRFRAVTQMRTSERERWAGTAAPTPPRQPQPPAAAARQQQATRRLRPRASPAAPGTPAAPAPAPPPAGAAAPPPPPPPSARATRCCSLLFDYHTRHGAEQLRSRQHPAKCAACGEPTAYHECVTCGVALHILGGRHSKDCHAKWHDPVYFGKLHADVRRRRTKRPRGAGVPIYNETDRHAIAVALQRVKREIAEGVAADTRMLARDEDE